MTEKKELPLPPSLQVFPNIQLKDQTLDQLRAERDYWDAEVKSAPGFSSAMAAEKFRCGCLHWIMLRESEEKAIENGGI